MIDGISSALSSVIAAGQRLDASAGNAASADSVGAIPGGPPGQSSPQAYKPARVDQGTGPGGGATATTSYVSPSYTPAYDATSRLANDQGPAATPNVNPARETAEQQSAAQAVQASLRTVEGVSNLVRKLYDLDS